MPSDLEQGGKRGVPLVRRFARAVAELGSWRPHLDGYRWWRLRNPRAPFRDFYLRQVERRLAAGGDHPSLGLRAMQQEHSREFGRNIFDCMVKTGIERHHRVLEYGCGSLRVGRFFIEYLDPGGYTGLDLTDRFYRDGVAALDPGLLASKRPWFSVIEAGELARQARTPPDVVISVAVLMHVFPEDLDEYFARVAGLFAPTTRGLLDFVGSARGHQLGTLSWAHAEPELVAVCARHGLRARGERLEGFSLSRRHRHCERRLLHLERA